LAKIIHGFVKLTLLGTSVQRHYFSRSQHRRPPDQPHQSSTSVKTSPAAGDERRAAALVRRPTQTLSTSISQYRTRGDDDGRGRRRNGVVGETTRGTVPVQRMGSELQPDQRRRRTAEGLSTEAAVAAVLRRRRRRRPPDENDSSAQQTGNQVRTLLHPHVR